MVFGVVFLKTDSDSIEKYGMVEKLPDVFPRPEQENRLQE